MANETNVTPGCTTVLLNIAWMNEGEVGKGFEIVSIKGEQMRHAVRLHHGGKPGIVCAATFDVML